MKESPEAARLLEALRTAPPAGETQPAIHITFNAPVIVTPEVAAALARILLRARSVEPQKP